MPTRCLSACVDNNWCACREIQTTVSCSEWLSVGRHCQYEMFGFYLRLLGHQTPVIRHVTYSTAHRCMTSFRWPNSKSLDIFPTVVARADLVNDRSTCRQPVIIVVCVKCVGCHKCLELMFWICMFWSNLLFFWKPDSSFSRQKSIARSACSLYRV